MKSRKKYSILILNCFSLDGFKMFGNLNVEDLPLSLRVQKFLFEPILEGEKPEEFLTDDYLLEVEQFKIEKIFENKNFEKLKETQKYEIGASFIKRASINIHKKLSSFDNIQSVLKKENFEMLSGKDDEKLFTLLCQLYDKKEYYLCFTSGISFLERTMGDILHLSKYQINSRELRMIVIF
jgi:restriction endonuclease S subunit